MSRNTSVTMGEHFERFIAKQIKAGRFESKSEVIRAAMRLLEEHEKKVATLRQALVDGESSGEAVPFVHDRCARRGVQRGRREPRRCLKS